MALNEALLPEFEHEMATLRKLFERLPEGKFGWKPHPKSFSTAELASHLAQIPSWISITLQTELLDLASPFPRPPLPERSQDVLERFDSNVTEARAAIASATDSQLNQPWSLKNGEQTLMTLPRAAVLRTFVMNHLIHHRGQLSLYLRMNDVPVPAIYGPSADES